MRLAFIGAVVAIVMALAAFAGETLDRVSTPGTLKVATNAGWPPQSFLDENNQLAGYDIDVANEIAKRLGVTAKFDTPEWGVMTGGRWGVAVGSITPPKPCSKILDFAGIHYHTPYVFALHADSEVTDPKQLNGKTIGVETGTTLEDYINRRLVSDASNVAPNGQPRSARSSLR